MNIKKLLIGFLVCLLLVSSVTIYAQTEEENMSQATCPSSIEQELNSIKLDFYDVLENQLETADFSSESLNFLFRTYREYQQQLRLTTVETDVNFSERNRLNTCQVYIDQTADEMRYVFMQTYSNVSARKRSFLLLEKLDAINEKLQLTHDNFTEIDRNISKFNDLFPCFAVDCITQ